MPRRSELTVLPSGVIGTDGNILELDELQEEEKSRIRNQMCQNIGRQMGAYYAARPEEWTAFVNEMSQDS